MKKHFTFILTAFLAANLGIAQITNPGFETWSNGTPTGWITTNVAGILESASQSSDAHNGNSSIEFTVETFNGNEIGGAAYQTDIPYSGEAANVSFYYKGTLNNTVSLLGVVTYSDDADNVIAIGTANILESTNSYTLVVLSPENVATGVISKASVTFSLVIGEGTATGNEYARIDDVAFGGVSNITEAQKPSIELSAYPNPSTNGIFQLEVSSEKGGRAEISVVDLTGKLLLSEKLNLNSGKNLLPYDLSFCEKGIYLIRVQTNDETNTTQVVID